MPPDFVTLGMFIIDEFSYLDEEGNPTGQMSSPQIGGGGTYAAVGARIWLEEDQIGMVVDRGHDWPSYVQKDLETYGAGMWMFRNQPESKTARALNSYMGEHRSFDYLTPRIRISPRDFKGTALEGARHLHFVCSPKRVKEMMAEVNEVPGWDPITVYEPIPDRCIPEELDALTQVLPDIHILSPNAVEVLTLLSMALLPTKEKIEAAAQRLIDIGVGPNGQGAVIIRSGELGAYVLTRSRGGRWIDAFWSPEEADKIVDVTGAGNSFLGGLAAGLTQTGGDVYKATLYGTVSASYTIEQLGLPTLSRAVDGSALWNDTDPHSRLQQLEEKYS